MTTRPLRPPFVPPADLSQHLALYDAGQPSSFLIGVEELGASPVSDVWVTAYFNRRRVGSLQTELRGDVLRVRGIGVVLHWQRFGIGTRLYEAAARWARERGLRLQSDSVRSESAENFWAKQEAKGRAKLVRSGNAIYNSSYLLNPGVTDLRGLANESTADESGTVFGYRVRGRRKQRIPFTFMRYGLQLLLHDGSGWVGDVTCTSLSRSSDEWVRFKKRGSVFLLERERLKRALHCGQTEL